VAELNLDIQDQLSIEELNALWNGYTTKVRQMIARAKIYPSGARDKGQQGKIDLSFKLGKNGGVLKLLVEHSSGHAMLDEAARDAVENAGPFPPIPEKLNKQYVLLKLPVSFILR
jgi:protein TonB